MDSKEYWREHRMHRKRVRYTLCWRCGRQVLDSQPECLECETENPAYQPRGEDEPHDH